VSEHTSDSANSDSQAEFHRIDLAPGVWVLPGAVRVQFARSGGPGGQNVNKLNTRAEMWIALDDIAGMSPAAIARLARIAGKRLTRDGCIHIIAQTERSQERNRQAVLDRLRLMVEQAIVEPKPRRATKPSRAAKRRRLETKRRRGQIKAKRSGGAEEE
jgi:ribosome-associated protein